MLAAQSVRIQKFAPKAGVDQYCFKTAYGEMLCSYRPNVLDYHIVTLEVARRRQGIGTLLLCRGFSHAYELGAQRIASHIMSRECLHAMTKVFGAENINVINVGDYAPEGEDYNEDDMTLADLAIDLRTATLPEVSRISQDAV